MTLEELVKSAAERGMEITQEMQGQLLKYAELLASWNEKMNLTSIVALEEVMEKHFFDCLLPLTVCEISGRVIDVGSGAGFPGMVFAVLRPDLQVTLLEPTGKRCQFLTEVRNQLGLKNVEIINERAEDYGKSHREIFDFATARAVAGLPILSELCIPLVKVGGKFVPMKGSIAEQESKEAEHAVQVLGGGKAECIHWTLPEAGDRALLVIPKIKSTPAKYPRVYGQIKKKPL